MLLADGDYLCANHFDDLQKRAAVEVAAGEDGFTESDGILQVEDGRSFPGEAGAAMRRGADAGCEAPRRIRIGFQKL